MARNFLQSESLCKPINFGKDSALREKSPRVPIQPVFSYRFGDGSDTGPAPQARRAVAKFPGAREKNPKVEAFGAPFYTTGGTIKPALHNPKLRK